MKKEKEDIRENVNVKCKPIKNYKISWQIE